MIQTIERETRNESDQLDIFSLKGIKRISFVGHIESGDSVMNIFHTELMAIVNIRFNRLYSSTYETHSESVHTTYLKCILFCKNVSESMVYKGHIVRKHRNKHKFHY